MIGSVRIGYRRYRVTKADTAEVDGDEVWGWCDKNGAEIRICTQCEPIVSADTLLHEILHGVWHEYGLPAEDEEDLVRAISTALTQVFHDTPELLDYLSWATDEFTNHQPTPEAIL